MTLITTVKAGRCKRRKALHPGSRRLRSRSLPASRTPCRPGPIPLRPTFAGGPQSLTLLTLDPHLRVPYAQDWNFTVEHTFGQGWLLEVGYVGTKGTKLPRFIESNPPVLCSTLPLEPAGLLHQRGAADRERLSPVLGLRS